jgi:glycosidase
VLSHNISIFVAFHKGFTNSSETIPVDPSYWEVNLKDEKKAEDSHYHVYKRLTDLRKYLSDADNLTIYDINNLTFAFSRYKIFE